MKGDDCGCAGDSATAVPEEPIGPDCRNAGAWPASNMNDSNSISSALNCGGFSSSPSNPSSFDKNQGIFSSAIPFYPPTECGLRIADCGM
jgi:hypothetical protein